MSVWLQIPLADYEGHMASPHIGQAKMLAGLFAASLKEWKPHSVALVGCAGGNGLEHIDTSVSPRVVALDVNATYLEVTRQRYAALLPGLELICADLESEEPNCPAVELAFAGLVFEHVRAELAMPRVVRLLAAGGVLVTVLQLPDSGRGVLSPSQFETLQVLANTTQLLAPARLESLAIANGLTPIASRELELPSGKAFAIASFVRSTAALPRADAKTPAGPEGSRVLRSSLPS